MPSIQDVADQINARLDQINTHSAATAQNTADLLVQATQSNTRLAQIDNTLGTGFANLSQGLFALLQIQSVALDLLDHNRRQNDTIICELASGNGLLCNIMRKLGRQVALSAAELEAVERIEGIAERARAGEAADYDRNLALQQRMEACCPPRPQPEEPCPEPCKAPAYKERRPGSQEWKPLPAPKQPNPVG